MATHVSTSTPTRRSIIAGVAATIPAAAVAAPATFAEGESPHERLLSRYRSCVAEFQANAEHLSDEERGEYVDRWWGIVQRALETPVKSARDLRAQFKLVQ